MVTSPRRVSSIDVVCVGEAMAMFVPEHRGRLSEDSLYRVSAAGAESNVARYLSRLGASSTWAGRIGADPFGEFILDVLADDGVDLSAVERDHQHPTGVAFKERGQEHTSVHYYRSGSAASAMNAEFVDTVWAFQPRILHLSGITPALSADCLGFMNAVVTTRPATSLISFDLNWRPALWKDADPSILREIAQSSDIVFVGLDEAHEAWQLTDVDQVRDAINRPRTLVVKRGADGCTVFEGRDRVDVSALAVDVVEPVGAGDAFAAGFLFGQLSGADMRRSARIGTIVASSALSVSTDVGEIPDQDHFERLLQLREDEWNTTRYPALKETSDRVPNR